MVRQNAGTDGATCDEQPTIEKGFRFHSMAGSTHSRTWEVTEVDGDDVHTKLVDQAVGYTYATDDVRRTWDLARVKRCLQMSDVNKGALYVDTR